MMTGSPKPPWLKIRPPNTEKFSRVKELLKKEGLHTVCTSAHCPNQSECWDCGTAAFMILGGTCTRACRFCAVNHGKKGDSLDPKEPEKIMHTVSLLSLRHTVITSVDRDDLADGGASQFAACVRALRRSTPKTTIELLIPDFGGDERRLRVVIDSKPEIIGHNIETVERLQKEVRDPQASYERSLWVLKTVKHLDPGILTKSSLMLGLGETQQEVVNAMKDLKAIGVDFVTLGQYLQPSQRHLPVKEYITPDVFGTMMRTGLELGFKGVFSGPFVRSSYRAAELLGGMGSA